MAYQPIVKDIETSILKINELQLASSFEIKMEGHYLHNAVFEITKGKRQYNFSSSSSIPHGLQTHKELQFDRETPIELHKTNQSLFVLGKHLFINNISYNEDFTLKIFSGGISSFSTATDYKLFDNKFLRFIMPVGEKHPFTITEFQHHYLISSSKKSSNYIPLKISEQELNFIEYKLGNQFYLIIDCVQPDLLVQFQKKCFNILLALGFIKGKLFHDECYIAAFDDIKMEVPENILYNSMRASVKSGQATFTSNPYSVYHDYELEMNEDGKTKQQMIDELNKEMIFFPIAVFSNLATMFFEQEKLQRAALIYIQSHIASLEVRIPNYYVALEAITGFVSKELSTEKTSYNPIRNKKIADDLISEITTLAKNKKAEMGLGDEDFNLGILLKNIGKLNAPPNADKLSGGFSHVKYELSREQKSILVNRNTFLHGSFLKVAGDDNQFKEALHVALRLHLMIAVLFYKLAGFSGRIINYAELWSHITEKDLKEERLVKI